MSNETLGNNTVSFWQRVALFGLIAGFVVMGALRLNDCDLFNPDSPRYLIYSRAIVDLGEYRATDLPGSPLYSWRPPGLSILLAPVMALFPYDVMAAKVVILTSGALLLWTVFELTRIHSQFWPAFLITAVVATSPSFLVLSTEVLTETPYTLGVCVVLLILGRSTVPIPSTTSTGFDRSRFLLMIAACLVLAFVPWLRTAGVSLVAAVGLWSILSTVRWHWLSGVVAAAMGLGLLAWRNKQAAGENYVGSLLTRIRGQGFGATTASGFDTIWHYLCTIPGLLLPGMTTDRAWYSPVLLESSATVYVSYVMAACIASAVILLALIGMCQRRAHGGSLALLYVSIYCACLVVWPWRHERFVWPLMPVVLCYLPAGFDCVSPMFPHVRAVLPSLGCVVLLLFCGWQAYGCQQIVAANRLFARDPDSFYKTQVPGFYFSDWRQAGQWLNAHTSPSSRVLTWHAAVAGTSHRFQKRVQFETQTFEQLRTQIESFSARYLVVPAAQYGDGFPWQSISASPSVKLNVVYQQRDVAILEVEPNRTGEISLSEHPDWIIAQIDQCAELLKKNPRRTDLAIRHASLLREAGRNEEAITAFKAVIEQGTKTVRVCSELGWLLYEARDYADASRYLDMASKLPNAEAIAKVLQDGAASARKRLNQTANVDDGVFAKQRLNTAKSLIGQLKFAAAERTIDELLKTEPKNAEGVFLKGKLLHLQGNELSAITHYEQAITLGSSDAGSWMAVILYRVALAKDFSSTFEVGGQQYAVDPDAATSHVRMAELYRQHGWAGRGLAVLKRANERFPDEPGIQQKLAELYCAFARPELAVPLYESALARNQDDQSLQKGLLAAQQKLFEPLMFPLASQEDDHPTKFQSSLDDRARR